MKNLRLDADSNSRQASLSFLDARFESESATGSDSYWMEFEARVEADDESTEVTLSMIAPYREDTLTFFEKLSSIPDGWLGSANWYSEYGKLVIDAQGDGNGFATLRIRIRQPDLWDEPSLAGQLVVGYNALRLFAKSLGTFLRVPPAPPGYQSPSVSSLGRWVFDDAPSSRPG